MLAKQQRTTKANKPYVSLVLGDKSGQIEGRIWEPGDARIAKEFDRGDTVKVRGSASRFDDRVQMKIDQLRKAQAGEVDKTDLLPCHDVRHCGAVGAFDGDSGERGQSRFEKAADGGACR